MSWSRHEVEDYVPSFAALIESAAEGEPIIGVVIGEGPWGEHDDDRPAIPTDMLNRDLLWDDARPLLDVGFDTGFGTADCPPVYVWTERAVLVVGTYDGSTWMERLPRHPIDTTPEMIGGG